MGKRVLYIGVGNPVAPSSGMDLVLREHILELLQLSTIELRGIVVQAGVAGGISKPFESPWPSFKFYTGDLQTEAGGVSRVINKVKHSFCNPAPLASYAFLSKAAQQAIASELATNYDLVIIDHMLAICNIHPFSLLALKDKMILIAHDVTPLYLLGTSRLINNIAAKLFHYDDAFKALIVESVLIKRAALTIFLSKWDEQWYGWLKANTISLCPILSERKVDKTERKFAKPYVVFVGGTGFAPNKAALEWIIGKLSPALAALAPDVSIRLVGKGTADLQDATQSNINHMGFVSDEQLSEILQDCLAVISPVVHGGGIKIKVLEAVMAGCPILATEESLRGFEFLNISPAIDLNRPEDTAKIIDHLKNVPEVQTAMRSQIQQSWNAYVDTNKNQFSKQILALLQMNSNTDVKTP